MNVPEHLRELGTVYKLNRLSLSESEGFFRVNAAADEDGAVNFFRRHDPKKLPHRLYADLEGFPAFTLHDGGLAITPEPEVHAAVRAAPTHFLDLIPAMAIDLGHLLLELLPTQPVQPIDVQMLLKECRPLLTELPPSHTRSEADHRRNGTQHDA
ncbi:MAG TPA: hypothetical protein VN673_02095, partial [Clostridia bacterium]|nr:hypothetical protein [Clostridia bacterium]